VSKYKIEKHILNQLQCHLKEKILSTAHKVSASYKCNVEVINNAGEEGNEVSGPWN